MSHYLSELALILFEKVFKFAVVSETLWNLFFERKIATAFLQKFVLSTFQVTLVIVCNSFLTANRCQNTSTSSATLLLWAFSFTVFFAGSSASAQTRVFIVSSISSANWFSLFSAEITSYKAISLFFTFSKVLKFSFIAFHFTKISVSYSIFSTSWHEYFRTVLTSLQNAWALSI